MITLERLKFDPADAASGPLVGSYMIAADGTLITHTGGAMNVNVTNSITVTATALNIRDLTHVSDSVKIGDGTDFLAVAGDGSISVSQNGTWNVNLTDDSVADGAVNSGNPFLVGGHAFNQAVALTAVTAGARVYQATDKYRRQFVSMAPGIGVLATAVTAGLTALPLPATPLAGRVKIEVQNNGTAPIYLGDAAVTTSSGIQVSKGGTYSCDLGEGALLYVISGSAAQNVRVMELA